MRTALLSTACLMLLAPSLRADDAKPKSDQEIESQPVSCHGTAVEFVENPVEAAKLLHPAFLKTL